MLALYKKELRYYLNNPIGYIVVILFVIFASFLFLKDIFVVGSASMKPFFTLLPWLFLVFIPALTMRIISEERRINTIEVLLTLPVSETQIVISKFFALATIIFISFILTLGIPFSLFFLANIYFPEIFIAYFGSFLMACSFIAVSMFFSSLTKNQVVAFLTSVIFLFLLLVVGTDFFGTMLPKTVIDFLIYFMPQYHFQNFIKGIFDGRSFIYFFSLISVFLFLTIVSLEKRN